MGLEERAQEKQIGDFKYKAQPVPFGVGRKALKRLMDIAAPVLSAAARERGMLFAAAAALEQLPTAFTDDDLERFSELFGDYSWVFIEGKWMPLVSARREQQFAGRYFDFAQWLRFCIEVNYKNFFDGMKSSDGVAALLKRVPSPSTESTPGTGSAGAS